MTRDPPNIINRHVDEKSVLSKVISDQSIEYTTVFLNTKTNFFWSIIVLVSLFIEFGCVIGNIISLIVLLQTKGVNYKSQAVLTVITYPFALKIFAAPFVDSMFFSSIGKSKTYIILAGIINSMLIYSLSFQIETFIEELDITAII